MGRSPAEREVATPQGSQEQVGDRTDMGAWLPRVRAQVGVEGGRQER